MDELILLRKVREDVAEPSTTALAHGRATVLAAASPGHAPAAAGPVRPHRVARRIGWTTLGVGITAAVAATLVLSNVVGLAGWRGGADPAAADSLGAAAAAAITTSDPVVGPGQYLEVSTQAVYASIGSDAGYLATQDGQVYIPADRADDWVWVRDAPTVAKTFGPRSVTMSQELDSSGGGDLVRAADGAFYNGTALDAGFSQLPRDPQQLLNEIYRRTLGQGPSVDGAALSFIADTLRTGVAPADLRAALYRAIAGIPGVTISDRTATLDGRTGVAFGRDESDGIRQEIIIDPTTGRLIGERQVLLRADVIPGFPAGESMGWTAVTTTVVDAAPSGGTICGTGMTPTGGAGSGRCRTS